jgi:hypothetical protein
MTNKCPLTKEEKDTALTQISLLMEESKEAIKVLKEKPDNLKDIEEWINNITNRVLEMAMFMTSLDINDKDISSINQKIAKIKEKMKYD